MNNDKDALPYSRQTLDDSDIAAVADALKQPYLTTGPLINKFEIAFAKTVGAEHAVVVNSGTAALHIAAMLLDFQPGDVAIVPAITFVATANAIRYVGGEVVFADVEPDTGLMGPSQLQDALRRAGNARIKAVFPVHLGGQTTDLSALQSIARERRIAIVEDSCHALGTIYGPRKDSVGACTHAALSCFSTHAVKAITMGEGGVLTTRDPKLANRARQLRSHGITRSVEDFVSADAGFNETNEPGPWYYEMQEIGFNYRATDFQCALGLTQLSKLHAFNERRRELVSRYDRHLAGLTPVLRPWRRTNCTPGWHLYGVLIDFPALGLSRSEVMAQLRAKGINTQVHYIPVNRQPYYRSRYGNTALPGADNFYARTLSLPLFPGMQDADVDRVVAALTRLIAPKRP